jgi:MFS family permease
MRWRPTTSQGSIRLAAAITSIVGFASAIWIYLTAGAAPGNPLGYDPEDSKRYLRDLERYGGKANIVAGEITDWFNGLWHGRRLAFIVACVTVIVAGALLLAAIPMDSDLGDESSNRTRRGEGDSP